MDRVARTLLIVDDSPEDRELYRRYLLRDAEHSYTILEATLGQQGLDLWQRHHPDAILLDHHLPDLNGLEFLAGLHAMTEQERLPVIMVTGQGNEAIAVQVMKAGAQDYLVKGQITPEGLQLTVNSTIATVQLHTQLQQRIEQERLFLQITQKIHQSLDLEEILATVLNETRQTLKVDRVAVYQFNSDWGGSFIAESVSEGWMPLVKSDQQDVWLDTHLQDTQGGRYQYNETFAVSDIYTSEHSQCHLDLLEQFQARAYAIAPVLLNDRLWGLLAIYQNGSARYWQEWEISLLKQIGIQTAIALRQSRLYQAVQTQVKELEQLNQLKDDFLSTVSHELRTPMSNIKMATQMLAISLKPSGILQDEASASHRYLKILREEVEREINLINDLLDLARLDAGTEPLNLTTIDLQSYIPHVIEAFGERTRHHHQQLLVQISQSLPLLTTDLAFLERILTELLNNACKYTPAGETITVSARSTGTALELRVSNSGVELPAAERDRIFDKFYRILNNDPWKHGGTGLGLALVKKLTEQLGGKIHVESSSGQTTFILELGWSPPHRS